MRDMNVQEAARSSLVSLPWEIARVDFFNRDLLRCVHSGLAMGVHFPLRFRRAKTKVVASDGEARKIGSLD